MAQIYQGNFDVSAVKRAMLKVFAEPPNVNCHFISRFIRSIFKSSEEEKEDDEWESSEADREEIESEEEEMVKEVEVGWLKLF